LTTFVPFGVTVDGWGGIHEWGVNGPITSRAVEGAPYWPDWDIARGIAVTCNGEGGYVLDGWGGLHPFAFGSNPMPPPVTTPPTYWPGWDIARGVTLNCDGQGWVVDAWGGFHGFGTGGTPAPANPTGPVAGTSAESYYTPGEPRIQGLTFDTPDDAPTMFVVAGDGNVWSFATSATPPWQPARNTTWPGGWEIARGISLDHSSATSEAEGGFVIDGWGGLHGVMAWGPGGGGSGGTSPGYGAPYWFGWDIARDVATGQYAVTTG
jgi:hypothetical protein